MTMQTTAPLTTHRLTTMPRTASDVITTYVVDGKMAMTPPYQRGSVWSDGQRIALIRSMIQSIPVPAVIINNRWTAGWATIDEPAYAVVDGKQRIETMTAWFADGFAIPATWLPADHVETTETTADGEWVRHTGLSRIGGRVFRLHAILPVIECSVGSVEEEASLYVLVNGGGVAQTPEDLARAALVATP